MTKTKTADSTSKAKPAPGRKDDPAIKKLAENINRLMGPEGDVIDVRSQRLAAA